MMAVSVSSRCRHSGPAGLLQHGLHNGRQIAGFELTGRQVHSNRQRDAGEAAGSQARLLARHLQHLGPKGTTRPLSSATEMNSIGGRIEPSFSAILASASKPTTCPVREIDDRLVVDDDPSVVQRGLQLLLCVSIAAALTTQRGVEHLDAAPAQRLRLVHRLVGFVEQDLRGATPADRDRDPDARTDMSASPNDGSARHQSCADVDGMGWLSTFAASTTNSSPPIRATVSCGGRRRSTARRPSAGPSRRLRGPGCR